MNRAYLSSPCLLSILCSKLLICPPRLALRILPEETYSLAYLRKLEAQSNVITQLSPAVGRLSRLMSLDLSGNDLVTLPAEIGPLRIWSLLVSSFSATWLTCTFDVSKLSSLVIIISSTSATAQADSGAKLYRPAARAQGHGVARQAGPSRQQTLQFSGTDRTSRLYRAP